MKKYFAILLVLAMLLLSACGSSSSSYDSMEFTNGAPQAPAATEIAGDYSPSNQTDASQGRKWILRMNIDAETEDLDATLEQVSQKVESLGGYIEDQDIYYGSGYSHRGRNASLTVRLPVENTDDFVAKVGETTNVTSQSKNLEDVTLRYVATESRMNALQAEEARLLELMDQAEDLSDLLEIESRLTDVRYELENITSQMRLLINQVDYATVNLNIEEVREYTPVAEPTFWERITTGLKENLEGLGEAAEDFIVWFITSLPTILVLVVLGGLLFLLLSKISKRKKVKAYPKNTGSVPAPKREDENK